MAKVWLVQAYGWGESTPDTLAAFTSEERANDWATAHNADPSSAYGGGGAHVTSLDLDPEYAATSPT
jgi:mannose-6-phosphate isomerase class I